MYSGDMLRHNNTDERLCLPHNGVTDDAINDSGFDSPSRTPQYGQQATHFRSPTTTSSMGFYKPLQSSTPINNSNIYKGSEECYNRSFTPIHHNSTQSKNCPNQNDSISPTGHSNSDGLVPRARFNGAISPGISKNTRWNSTSFDINNDVTALRLEPQNPKFTPSIQNNNDDCNSQTPTVCDSNNQSANNNANSRSHPCKEPSAKRKCLSEVDERMSWNCDATSKSVTSENKEYPDYVQTMRITDSNGCTKELVFPKALDLDRPKRMRTTFTGEQLSSLEQEFRDNAYLVGKERSELAGRLGLSETQIKVWYQNRRTKRKKCEGGPTPSGPALSGHALPTHPLSSAPTSLHYQPQLSSTLKLMTSPFPAAVHPYSSTYPTSYPIPPYPTYIHTQQQFFYPSFNNS